MMTSISIEIKRIRGYEYSYIGEMFHKDVRDLKA